MFWERFYSLCKDNGVTPTQVVTSLNISHGAPTKWKQGNIPTGENLIKLSEYFGVSVDYLLGMQADFKLGTELEKTILELSEELNEPFEKLLDIFLHKRIPATLNKDTLRFFFAFHLNKNVFDSKVLTIKEKALIDTCAFLDDESVDKVIEYARLLKMKKESQT